MVQKSAEFRAEIKGNKPLLTLLRQFLTSWQVDSISLYLRGMLHSTNTQKVEEVIEGEDDEDIPVDISCDGSGQSGFTKWYKSVGDVIVHNENQDEAAEGEKDEKGGKWV